MSETTTQIAMLVITFTLPAADKRIAFPRDVAPDSDGNAASREVAPEVARWFWSYLQVAEYLQVADISGPSPVWVPNGSNYRVENIHHPLGV